MFVILTQIKQPMHKYFKLIFRMYVMAGCFILLNYCVVQGQTLPENGKFLTYHKNGKVAEKGFYLQNQKHRIWYFYNEFGVVIKKERWKSGKLMWQIFYEKGKVTKTIDKDGKVTERPACGC